MNLDDKLREKLKALVFDEWNYQDFLKEGLESYVAAIHQAFADEYDLHLKNPFGEGIVESVPTMTGQEWYERFEKELGKTPVTPELRVWHISQDKVLEAAKKATGIK